VPVHLGHGGDDGDATSGEVDRPDTQRGCLAPAQARVGEEADEPAVVSALLREHRHLGVIEVPVRGQGGPGERDAHGRVAGEPTVLDSPVEQLP
jgi:hypothetical protein